MTGPEGVGREPEGDVEMTLALGDRTRARILAAARELILAGGGHAVQMIEVARAAEVSRATLYRYFSDLRSIVLALVESDFQTGLLSGPPLAAIGAQASGGARFAGFMTQVLEQFRTDSDFFALLVMADAAYGRADDSPLGEFYNALFESSFGEDSPMRALIDGQADGSVRPDLDPYLYPLATLAALVSLAGHLAAIDRSVTDLYGYDAQTLLGAVIDVFVAGALSGPAGTPLNVDPGPTPLNGGAPTT